MASHEADQEFEATKGALRREPIKMETPYGIRVTSVKDVTPDAFIKAYATHLKSSGKFRLPQWVDTIKTAPSRELAPYDPDWLYVRAAAIIRHLYIRPDQGVNAFRTIYGRKKRRGAQPGHHSKAAGGCVRYCLQQFENMGLVKKGDKGGRRLTSKGQAEITAISRQVGEVKGHSNYEKKTIA